MTLEQIIAANKLPDQTQLYQICLQTELQILLVERIDTLIDQFKEQKIDRQADRQRDKNDAARMRIIDRKDKGGK